MPGRARSPLGRGGFTLIEVMVIIALLGALAAVLAVGASRALTERAESPEEIFWAAINETRKQALLNETDVVLSFDADEQVFRALAMGEQKEFPVPIEGRMELDFLGVSGGDQTVMIGGRLVEAGVIDSVTFFSDGTCLSFRARMSIAAREPVLFEIDPWTCAPILREEEDRF